MNKNSTYKHLLFKRITFVYEHAISNNKYNNIVLIQNKRLFLTYVV